jgi:hypothetical protein
MTRARLHIRAGQHGQASALTTAVCLSPAAGPSVPGDVERLEAALLGMLGNPALSCPSPIAVPSSIAAPSSPAGTILLA